MQALEVLEKIRQLEEIRRGVEAVVQKYRASGEYDKWMEELCTSIEESLT